MLLYFYDDWGIVVDRSTISRLLKSMGISRKMLKRIAAERNQDCRNGYQFQVANYSADMLVYVDESAGLRADYSTKAGRKAGSREL